MSPLWAEVALPLPLDQLFTYRVREELRPQIQVGQSVFVPFRQHSLKGVVVKLSDRSPLSGEGGSAPALTAGALKEIQFILSPQLVIPPQLLELTRWIADKYGSAWGEALALISAAAGKPKKFSRAMPAEPEEAFQEKRPDYALTQDQDRALAAVKAAIRNGESRAFLLFGVTSSGKTEVYLHAIAETLARGKQALFLVPEITLCRPFLETLKSRFGPRVGLWHSQVTLKEKNSVFEKIRSGAVDVVVGARSALFAPFPRLGAVILDEEHDPSYKQDEKPRYHAREAALKLIELHRAVALLGSATPSIETYHRALNGNFTLLELPGRVPSHSIPQVTVVDRREKPFTPSPFTPALVQAVTQALSRREQAILALNRRGFSTYLLCGECGRVWKCPSCQLTLVHHQEGEGEQAKDSLRCHYCFYENPLPKKCPDCGAEAFFMGGYGTQKLVQEARKSFPYARILRLDGDVARRKNASAETYRRFKDETADILVGTQMVTQGFDFPRVTLVGIVDADTALYHPDFRASERAFQWISQAAGRAGRSPMGGAVIAQSTLPDHYALQTAARHDYRAFYEKEIEFRKALGYPPFSKLVLFRLQSQTKKAQVPQEAGKLADALRNGARAGDGWSQKVQILGPGPAPRETLRKQLRWQVLAKCQDDGAVARMVGIGKDFSPKAGVRLVIDVDPYEML